MRIETTLERFFHGTERPWPDTTKTTENRTEKASTEKEAQPKPDVATIKRKRLGSIRRNVWVAIPVRTTKTERVKNKP